MFLHHLLLLSLSLYTLEERYSVGQSDRFCSPSRSSLGRAALRETVNQKEEFGAGGCVCGCSGEEVCRKFIADTSKIL